MIKYKVLVDVTQALSNVSEEFTKVAELLEKINKEGLKEIKEEGYSSIVLHKYYNRPHCDFVKLLLREYGIGKHAFYEQKKTVIFFNEKDKNFEYIMNKTKKILQIHNIALRRTDITQGRDYIGYECYYTNMEK